METRRQQQVAYLSLSGTKVFQLFIVLLYKKKIDKDTSKTVITKCQVCRGLPHWRQHIYRTKSDHSDSKTNPDLVIGILTASYDDQIP